MVEKIVNEIIVETAKAVKAMDAIQKKFEGYNKSLIKVAAAEDKASKSADKARLFFDKLAGTTSKATKTAKELAAATKAATEESKRNEEQTRRQKKSADDLGVSWTTVKRIFAGQIIFRALSAITNQMRDSVGVAQELEIKLAEAITIAPGSLNLSINGIRKLGLEIRKLSESFGIDQVELATAAYQVYSNQIGNAAESTEFLRTAVLFAKATVTDTANAVDLLSGVVNSYGLEAAEAAKISDIFTKAVELGRFRIDDIANSFGRLTPIAATLGIQIDELAAAFSTITIKGVSPDKAITQLLAIMLKMVKPSKALSKALTEIGFANIKQATSTLGLVGTLKALTATTDGTIEALGRLFPRVRGIQGVLGLVNDEGEKFNKIYTEIQDTAAGATQKYAEFIQGIEAEEFKRNIQTIKNFFVDEFGIGVIETVNNVLEALGGIPGAVDKLSESLKLLSAIVAALVINRLSGSIELLSIRFGSASTAAAFFGATLKTIPFVALVVGATALGFALGKLIDSLILGGHEAAKLVRQQKELEQSTKELATAVVNSSFEQVTALRDAALEQVDLVRDSLREQLTLNEDHVNRIRFLGQEVTGGLNDALGRRLKDFEDFLKDATNALENAEKDAARIDTDINKLKARGEQELFDLRIRNLNKRQQREARAQRAINLLRRARAETDPAEARALFAAAAANASRAKSSRLVSTILDARIKSLESEKDQLRKNAVLLDRMVPTIANAIKKMKELQEAAKGFGEDLATAVQELDENAFDKAAASLSKEIRKFEGVQRALEDVMGAAFNTSLTSLREGLGNIFSDPALLSFRFDQVTKDIKKEFENFKLTVEVFGKLKLLGFEGGPDATRTQALDFLGFKEKQIRAAAEGIPDQIIKIIVPLLEKTRQLLAQEQPLFPKGFIPGALFTDGIEPVDQKAIANLKELATELESVKKALSLKKGEIVSIEVLKELGLTSESTKNKIKELREQGFDKAADSLEALNRQLEANRNILGVLEGIKKLSEDTKGVTKGFDSIKDKAPAAIEALENTAIKAGAAASGMNRISKESARIGPVTQTAADQATTSLDNIGISALSQIPRVNALADAMANLAAQRAAAAFVATGGQIPSFLASGGPTQARGTDTVAVQAAPGEFFVNAASSRRFIPELSAINQGRMPEPRNNSQVTNNSFSGDININVPAGTSVNGRTIAADIRRELRRKTSSLS